MYTIDLSKPCHIYFIGIGGISMSGLALILADRGFDISGSDRSPSEQTSLLERSHIKVFYGQKAENLALADASADVPVSAVVYTAAIHPDNPEYAEAVRRNLPMLSRAELLGQMMGNYRLPVAVSGTHGKTTVTSMVSAILLEAGTDPTLTIGGVMKEIGSNVRIGHSDLFVTEACEYTNSFLSFKPGIGIILNIEEDHLDFFKDLEDIRNSFRRFAQLLPPEGALIINGNIERLDELISGLTCDIIRYVPLTSVDDAVSDGNITGQNRADTADTPDKPVCSDGLPCDYHAQDPVCGTDGCYCFTLSGPGISLPIKLSVPGRHNVGNALAAAAAAAFLLSDLPTATLEKAITEGLRNFHGAERRFEYKGTVNGVTVVDDYAHHPAEIRASLRSATSVLSGGELWVVFQPHAYSRTKAFLDDFADALSGADHVVMADIYAARETDDLGVSSALLSDLICSKGGHSVYLPSFEKIEKYLLENCTKDDLLITMGAGDVYKIGDTLVSK